MPMTDDSHLDRKYFIDSDTFNCPFCNRKNLPFINDAHIDFDWSEGKRCHIYTVRCSHCMKISAHFSFKDLRVAGNKHFRRELELDDEIFHSQPSSFFVIDRRIPSELRDLITEAEQSQKMNYLTGASACMRKAIYEFLLLKEIPFSETVVVEGAKKSVELSYEKRIKLLKEKHPEVDPEYFDTLAAIQGMTSDKVHEQSWDKWDSKTIKFLLETLKIILDEIYVTPEKRKERRRGITALKEAISAGKEST